MNKIITITNVTLLVSLGLAAVAGVFSVYGMMAIFAGLPVVGIAAGVACEIGKLTGVSWLYRFWADKVWFRIPLACCVMAAMAVTSIGVFGMLSKAHTDKATPTSHVASNLELIDNSIDMESNKITNSQRALAQMDSQIDVLIKHSKISAKGGAVDVQKSQQFERKHLETIISESRDKINTLRNNKFKLDSELIDLKSDMGPLVQLAELLYGDGNDTANLDKAVRILILMILVALDPLAIMLLMAYNHMRMKELPAEPKRESLPLPEPSPEPLLEPSPEPLLEPSPETLLEPLTEPSPEPLPDQIDNEPSIMLDDISDAILPDPPIITDEPSVVKKKRSPNKRANWFF